MGWNLTDAKNPHEEELDKLFKAAKSAGRTAHLLIVLAYNGALRVSEALHVRVSDFNWSTSRMRMVPFKKAGRRRVKQNDGSFKAVDRDLPAAIEYPLPVSVVKMVREYVEAEGLKPSSWLFPGRTGRGGCHIVKLECPGGHMSKRNGQKIWDAVCEKAGIKVPGRGIHSLKHARGTEIARKTKDPYLVKEMLRHGSVSMSDHYVKYVNIKEQVDDIGGRF